MSQSSMPNNDRVFNLPASNTQYSMSSGTDVQRMNSSNGSPSALDSFRKSSKHRRLNSGNSFGMSEHVRK